MSTKGPSSPTNVVDDVCHSTNDDNNNTNVSDNSDKAELSTVDKSVNNEASLDIGEESATNDGNDRDTSYQEDTAVDDIDNNTSVEQQRVGGQDENNSTVQTNNVVGGESQAQVADEQRITSTPCGTSIIDDESTQSSSSSQTVTEDNDQAIPLEQANIYQLMNMLQNNTDNTARIADIVATLLLRYNQLSSENADMKELVQQKLESPAFDEVLARLFSVESDNEKFKKQLKKLSRAVKNGQKNHSSLETRVNQVEGRVDGLEDDVEELKESRSKLSDEEEEILEEVLFAFREVHGPNVSAWPNETFKSVLSSFKSKLIENNISVDEELHSFTKITRHCKKINPFAIPLDELSDKQLMFLVVFLFGDNGLYQGSGRIPWSRAAQALFDKHNVVVVPDKINNLFTSTLKGALKRKRMTIESESDIVKIVNEKLGAKLSIVDGMKLVRKVFPDIEFPALSSETSADTSVSSSTTASVDTMKSTTLTVTTTASTDDNLSSVGLSSAADDEMSSVDMSSVQTTLTTPREFDDDEQDSFVHRPPGKSTEAAGTVSSPRQTTVTFQTPKANNKSSRNNNSMSEDNAVRPSDTTSSLATVIEEGETHTAAAATTTVSTTDTISNIKSATSLDLAVVTSEMAGDLVSPRDAKSEQDESTSALARVTEEVPTFGGVSLFNGVDSYRQMKEEQSKTVPLHLRTQFHSWSHIPPPPKGPSVKDIRHVKHLYNSGDLKKKEEALARIRWWCSSDIAWDANKLLLLIEQGGMDILTESLSVNFGTLRKAAAMAVCSLLYKCDTKEVIKLMPAIVLACELLDRRSADSITGSNTLSFIIAYCKKVRQYSLFWSFLCHSVISPLSSEKRKLHCIEALSLLISQVKDKNIDKEVRKYGAQGLEETLRVQITEASKKATTSYTGWLERAYPKGHKNDEIRNKLKDCHKKLAAAIKKKKKKK